MGKKLLREFYELCEGGVCKDLLTEEEKRFVSEGGMILSGIMQMCEPLMETSEFTLDLSLKEK